MEIDVKALFEAAKYSKIINLGEPKERLGLIYWLGAHVFTGREEQARLILKESYTSLCPDELIEAHFYILLTSLRRSHYPDMQADIWKLFKVCSRNRGHVSRFFLNQGLALLRYYKGEFAKASDFALRAFRESLSIKRDYLSMIALDLLGHSHCMVESYSQGFEYFEEANRFAQRIKNNQNSEVIKLSIMTYKIESGRDLLHVEEQLDQWIEKIKVEDYFTKSNALILKAKILQLKGFFGRAETLLNEIGKDIFTINQGRQILNYNLCLGILRCVTDDPNRSMNLVQTSTKLCDRGQDNYFLHRFKELENYISHNESSEGELLKLSSLTGRRLKKEYPLGIVPEEYIREIFKEEKAFPLKSQTVLELSHKGLLGLVRLANFYKERSNFIDFTQENRVVFLSLNNDLHFIEDLTAKQYELLQILMEKETWTRKEIFERFWQVEYDSFIHDNKIYVTLKRLREKLGVAHSLIKLDKGEIKVDKFEVYSKGRVAYRTSSHLGELEDFLGSGLNPRQIHYLNSSQVGDTITPCIYGSRYVVSRNTVTRDLRELVRKGYLKKFGKHKGTFYCRH